MPFVEVSHLVKRFTRDAGWFRKGVTIAAVDDVSFAIDEGETFGLVGESGSGKTTVGRCLLRLVEPTAGEIRFRGQPIASISPSPFRRYRAKRPFVSQPPSDPLTPPWPGRQAPREPLDLHTDLNGRQKE